MRILFANRDLRSLILLAASSAARLLLALFTVKVTALYLGLVGAGVIGQFNNLLLISTMIAGGGISAGITNIATRNEPNSVFLSDRLASAHGYGLIFTCLFAGVFFFAKESFSSFLLPIADGGNLLIALVLGHFVFFYISILGVVLNSFKRQDLFATATLLSSVLTAISVSYGCITYGLIGALSGILVGTLSQWIFLFYFVRKINSRIALLCFPKFIVTDIRYWGHFTCLTLVTIVGMPLTQILVRKSLAQHSGWESVGEWQAMVRVSDAYLQFGLLFLSSFYFPRLAVIDTLGASLEVIKRYAYWVLPIMLCVFTGLYFGREFIVSILFSEQFYNVTKLFFPQLVGDFFKISSYLLTYAFFTAGYFKLSMLVEVLQALLFWSFAVTLGSHYHAEGVTWGYAATYSTYFFIVANIFFWLKKKEKLRMKIGRV